MAVVNPILPVYEFVVQAFAIMPAPFIRYIVMTFILSAVFWLIELVVVGGG